MPRLPKNSAPIHPGEVLQEEFLVPFGLTQSELAVKLGVPFQRINLIVNGKRGITPDTALRLSRFFGTTPDVWLNLQLAWDLWHAVHSPDAEEIDKIQPFKGAA